MSNTKETIIEKTKLDTQVDGKDVYHYEVKENWTNKLVLWFNSFNSDIPYDELKKSAEWSIKDLPKYDIVQVGDGATMQLGRWEIWLKDYVLHNLNGPAMMDIYDGEERFYIYNEKLSKREFGKQSSLLKIKVMKKMVAPIRWLQCQSRTPPGVYKG